MPRLFIDSVGLLFGNTKFHVPPDVVRVQGEVKITEVLPITSEAGEILKLKGKPTDRFDSLHSVGYASGGIPSILKRPESTGRLVGTEILPATTGLLTTPNFSDQSILPTIHLSMKNAVVDFLREASPRFNRYITEKEAKKNMKEITDAVSSIGQQLKAIIHNMDVDSFVNNVEYRYSIHQQLNEVRGNSQIPDALFRVLENENISSHSYAKNQMNAMNASVGEAIGRKLMEKGYLTNNQIGVPDAKKLTGDQLADHLAKMEIKGDLGNLTDRQRAEFAVWKRDPVNYYGYNHSGNAKQSAILLEQEILEAQFTDGLTKSNFVDRVTEFRDKSLKMRGQLDSKSNELRTMENKLFAQNSILSGLQSEFMELQEKIATLNDAANYFKSTNRSTPSELLTEIRALSEQSASIVLAQNTQTSNINSLREKMRTLEEEKRSIYIKDQALHSLAEQFSSIRSRNLPD